MSQTNDLKENLKQLHSHLHSSLIALDNVMKTLGATPEPDTGSASYTLPDRKRFSGLSDGEFGLFAVFIQYDIDGEEFPGLIEHLTAWEVSFMEDWINKSVVEYNLSKKQEAVFEKIAAKLSYNIHYSVGDIPEPQEEAFDDDIPF